MPSGMRRHGRQVHSPKPGSASPVMPDLVRAYDIDNNPSRPIRPSPLTASTIQGLPLELIDRLRSFPLFASAPDTFLGAIGKSLRPQIHQPHDTIISEGEDARAMYWLVRGSVRVTSRDGESTYAELKPGAFFGEIGILMDIPRTATIIASMRSLVLRLNKEDLQNELPNFPQVERAIREEAVERLAILERKKKEGNGSLMSAAPGLRKRSRDYMAGDVEMGEAGALSEGEIIIAAKKRKSPSPSLADTVASGVFGMGAFAKAPMTIRQILKELPLFRNLPEEILHFLGMNVQPCTYAPFNDIIKQGTQGREVYFIVQGEVEVVTETLPVDVPMTDHDQTTTIKPVQRVRARFRSGQYFGEVASLALAPTRTATVRSINKVDCLRITGEVLDELWQKCSPDLRLQVEIEAKKRMDDRDPSTYDGTTEMSSPNSFASNQRRITPTVTFSEIGFESPKNRDNAAAPEPMDPDPFFSIDLDVPRMKSRRSSLAPPSTEPAQAIGGDDPGQRQSLLQGLYSQSLSSLKTKTSPLSTPSSPTCPSAPIIASNLSPASRKRATGSLPESILILVFRHLDLANLMRVRRVSTAWHKAATTNPDLMHDLDLSRLNRNLTDDVLIRSIVPFVGSRPRYVNLNNCFHLSDEGFGALATACAENVRVWKMRSVWDVTGSSILELVSKAPKLEEIDLSNCRKVGDNLLARIVGWASIQQSSDGAAGLGLGIATSGAGLTPNSGSMRLKRLTLSYCKHVQDRSMAHIAQHAAQHLEVIDLTRCTSVTDQGFRHWSMHSFPVLRKLVLADCTYLTDQAIVGIANAARNLRELDLSFCCALSDTATEVLSLGLTQLTHLDLAFCGSAVSDSSLRCIGLHLLELKFLSVRGCVRVTGQGVEGVVDGCGGLETFDVSQCKNLQPWLTNGGLQAARNRGCTTRFDLVADGTWRTVI